MQPVSSQGAFTLHFTKIHMKYEEQLTLHDFLLIMARANADVRALMCPHK